MSVEPIQSMHVDRITVHVFESNEKLGQRAANDLVSLLAPIIAKQGRVTIILATGNSQLTFINAFRVQKIAWNKIIVFHMDEYLGMSDQHPASFPRWMREKLVDVVHPSAFYPIRGDAPDVKFELTRYAELVRRYPPDACVLGIGENGHLAFNDPPANFETSEIIHIVDLDAKCRAQQVNEGHFSGLDDVPKQAITLTVPALLAAKYVLAIVPEARKAEPVKAALKGPVTPQCPASILRTRPNVTLYLDRESASLLQ